MFCDYLFWYQQFNRAKILLEITDHFFSFKVIRARFEENWKFNPLFPQFKSSSRLRKEKQINLLLSHLLLATGALGRLSSWKSFCQKVPICKVLRQCFRQSCRDKFCRINLLYISHITSEIKFLLFYLVLATNCSTNSTFIQYILIEAHSIDKNSIYCIYCTYINEQNCHFQWKGLSKCPINGTKGVQEVEN